MHSRTIDLDSALLLCRSASKSRQTGLGKSDSPEPGTLAAFCHDKPFSDRHQRLESFSCTSPSSTQILNTSNAPCSHILDALYTLWLYVR